jgi:vitamin B12 transporter
MQRRSYVAVLAALAATGLAGGAAAQDETDDGSILLKTITVSASSQPVETGRTGAVVNVLTEDVLKRSGQTSMASVLARLPGVTMTRAGGIGTSTALRLRGLSGPYIGVRIDGIDVADPSGTQCAYDFGSTTAGGVSRVEVLRGSQSALFGSEAVGGVVDITTFRATEEGTEAEIALETGSNATYSGTGSVAMKTDRVELAFSASRTVTDGISAYAFGTEDDAFRSTTLSFYGSYKLNDALTIGANGFARDSYSEFDSQTADNAQTEEGKLRALRAFATMEAGNFTHEISASHAETERFYPLGFIQLYSGDRNQITYKGKWQQSDALALTWGLDSTRETFGAGTDAGTSTTRSVFSEALYAPRDDLDLSLALRYDDHSAFGGKPSVRAAMAWRPNDEWVLRAVASTGFRAPSLFELHSIYGDPSLKPESSRSFELGAEYLLPNGSVQMTLFNTRIEDMIGFDGASVACPSGFGCYNQVPGTTRTRGVELTGQTEFSNGWSLFGNYTFTDAKTANAGVETRLIRVPRHDLTMGVEANMANGFGASLSVQHVADFLDSGPWPAGTSKMPDYTVANLAFTHDINDMAQAYLRIENLFDADYQTVRNYGQPGRSVFVGLRAKF